MHLSTRQTNSLIYISDLDVNSPNDLCHLLGALMLLLFLFCFWVFCTIVKIQQPKWIHRVDQFHLLLQGQTHLETFAGRQSSLSRPHSYVPFNVHLKSNNVLPVFDGRQHGAGGKCTVPVRRGSRWGSVSLVIVSLFPKVFFFSVFTSSVLFFYLDEWKNMQKRQLRLNNKFRE